MRSAALRGLLASGVVATSCVVLTPGAAVAADDDYACESLTPQSREGEPVRDPSAPVVALDIDRAQELTEEISGRTAGAGVKVAVVDSGVSGRAAINRPETGETVTLSREFVGYQSVPVFYHGTAMAGVIAGRPVDERGVGTVGIAPAAEVVDVHIYDVPSDTDKETQEIGLTLEGLVTGLNDIRGQVGSGENKIRIVNISLVGNQHSPALERAIRALTKRGAIVVTSSGNRYLSNGPDAEPFEPGEDFAGRFFPAAYAHDDPQGRWKGNPRIVVAGSVIPDGSEPDNPPVALNSDIDVVVPTDNVVTYSYVGDPCRIVAPSTSIAAAEVSGILALLMTAFPKAGPDELIKRLEVTAAGETSSDPMAPERFQGKGVVQPVEALTRASINGPPPGTRRRPAVAPAVIPEPEPDLLAGTRGDAVWWGLAGGGALVVALVLRPVLARRRRAES